MLVPAKGNLVPSNCNYVIQNENTNQRQQFFFQEVQTASVYTAQKLMGFVF